MSENSGLAEIAEVIEVVSDGQLATINRSDIETQVSTAHRYPRSLSVFTNRALTLAKHSKEMAEACSYSVPRAGKKIEGVSIRLAEIVAGAWGNIRVGSRVTSIDRNFVKATGFAHDLETNLQVSTECSRRITDKYGKRYSDDMIQTTANAACSIARRNAILQVIPRAFAEEIRQEAKKVAAGQLGPITKARADAVEYFVKLGISKERILHAFEKTSIDDIDESDIIDLRGMAASIKSKEMLLEDAFPDIPQEDAKTGVDKLEAKIDSKETKSGTTSS